MCLLFLPWGETMVHDNVNLQYGHVYMARRPPNAVGQIEMSIVTPNVTAFGTNVPIASFVPATPAGGYGQLRPFGEIASEQPWGYVSTAATPPFAPPASG